MQLQLFGTSGCHLCEQAEDIIAACRVGHNVTLDNIDIAEQEQWQARYATRIPVLLHLATQQELGWPFDFATVMAFITGLKNDD
jgi:hypothetical protein